MFKEKQMFIMHSIRKLSDCNQLWVMVQGFSLPLYDKEHA